MRKTLVQRFLSVAEQEKITTTVQQMEKQTSGEIVSMVVSQSHSYPVPMIYGASILALFVSLLLMPVLGRILWLGTQNVWVFIVLFAVFYSLFYGLIDRMSWLKRLFVTKRQVEIEVQKAAITHFFTERLYRTKDANGILLFISIFERQAWVLADSGINACIDQRQWQAVIDHVTEGIKREQPGEAICEAIVTIGDLLKTHFPIQGNDNNELHDNIILST